MANQKGFRTQPEPTKEQIIKGHGQQITNLFNMCQELNNRTMKMHRALTQITEALEVKTDATIITLKKKTGATDEDFSESVTEAKETLKIEKEKAQDQLDQVHDSTEAIKMGDVVVMDFVGSIDGKPFQGGSAESFRFKLGDKKLLQDLQDSIVGKNVGDEFDTVVKFPANYLVKDLAGKDANFKVKIVKVKSPITTKEEKVEDNKTEENNVQS